MTVKEAETKVCPFISNCVSTDTHAGPYTTLCITGGCMAWQYQNPDNWFNTCDKVTTHGYCKRLTHG